MYSLPRKLTYGTWKNGGLEDDIFSVAKQGQPSRIPIWAVEVEGKNQLYILYMNVTHGSPKKLIVHQVHPSKMMVPFQMVPFSGTFGAFSQGMGVPPKADFPHFSTGTWRLCSHPLSLPRCHPLPWSGEEGSKVKLAERWLTLVKTYANPSC